MTIYTPDNWALDAEKLNQVLVGLKRTLEDWG